MYHYNDIIKEKKTIFHFKINSGRRDHYSNLIRLSNKFLFLRV